jgi:hypothetical protein
MVDLAGMKYVKKKLICYEDAYVPGHPKPFVSGTSCEIERPSEIWSEMWGVEMPDFRKP